MQWPSYYLLGCKGEVAHAPPFFSSRVLCFFGFYYSSPKMKLSDLGEAKQPLQFYYLHLLVKLLFQHTLHE